MLKLRAIGGVWAVGGLGLQKKQPERPKNNNPQATQWVECTATGCRGPIDGGIAATRATTVHVRSVLHTELIACCLVLLE